jgi:hypothetical protein
MLCWSCGSVLLRAGERRRCAEQRSRVVIRECSGPGGSRLRLGALAGRGRALCHAEPSGQQERC